MSTCRASYETTDGPANCALKRGHKPDHETSIGRWEGHKGYGVMTWKKRQQRRAIRPVYVPSPPPARKVGDTKACPHGTAHHAVRVSVAGGVIQCGARGCLCSRRIGEPHSKGLYV